MRALKDHIVKGDPLQNQLTIEVLDEPGAGGASHLYVIYRFKSPQYSRWVEDNLEVHKGDEPRIQTQVTIPFQNGPIKEAGVNGITQEALLAIVIDRLRSFQAGSFPCEENDEALAHCVNALEHLKCRTMKRIKRGVEGTTKA